jgi:uncharacterized protein YukE
MQDQNDNYRKLNEHFADWAKLSERVRSTLQSRAEEMSNLQASLAKFAESAEFKAAAHSIGRMQEVARSQIGQVAPQLSEYITSMQRQIAPAFESLQKSFEQLPPATKRALGTLAEHGWFLDFDLPITALWGIEKAIVEGNIAEAEAELIDHYQGRLAEIETSIIERFPERERFIRSAFAAHRGGDYAASIPLMLAQTDGICKDATDECLFTKYQGKPGTAKYVDRLAADTFRAALLSPLTLRLPMAASEHDREPNFRGLNRHIVLHGESLDYDSKTNATKAVSLIHYVAQVLSPEKDA